MEIQKFRDPDFIPNDEFCDMIDENNGDLNMLKFSSDGMITVIHLLDSSKLEYFIDNIKQTSNKFLKLAYFEYIKTSLVQDYHKLLNQFNLIPLYHEVALNILIQQNTRYDPSWLIIEFIKLAHRAKIPNQEMFDKIGEVLRLVINQDRNPRWILKKFINLEGRILKSAKIPDSVYEAIDYWVDEKFNGNITVDIPYTDDIIAFYKKMGMYEQIKSKKSIFCNKYLHFYQAEVDNEKWNEKRMDAMVQKHHFLIFKLEVIHKYNPENLDLINEVKLELGGISKLIPNLNEGGVLISGGGKIPGSKIDNFLNHFKNDSLEEIINKTIKFDYFLPEIPPNVSSSTGWLPTTYFAGTFVKKFSAGGQSNESGSSDIILKSAGYEVERDFKLFLFQELTKKFDKKDIKKTILAPINKSVIINQVSKKMFQDALQAYFDENYFTSIQTCIFQIESILKEICLDNSIEIIAIDDDRERQRTMKPLMQKLKEIVNKKTLTFINWLLLNEGEMFPKNYRHEIAHGLGTLDQYSEIYVKKNALSLILIYLSLSKYGD